MSAESEPPENKLTITYHPKDLISILERNGYLTIHSLMQELECGQTEAIWIITDLKDLGVVISSDGDLIINKEGTTVERVYRLTETGRQKRNEFNQRKVELTPMPAFAKMALEVINDLPATARARGWDFNDLVEMIRTNDPKLNELLDQRRIAVLNEFSSEDLKQLATDTKLFKS